MNFVFAYCVVILTNQIVYFNFEDDKSSFVVTFLCQLGHVV